MPRRSSSRRRPAIDADAVAAIAQRARETSDDDERELVLLDGLLSRGADFVFELEALDAALGDEAGGLLVRWLEGERLTRRADEAELRARTGRRLLDADGDASNTVVMRLAAVAVLSLPEGHPERDVGESQRLLLAALCATDDDGDLEQNVRTRASLLEFDLVPRELAHDFIDAGLSRLDAEADPLGAEQFLLASQSYARGRAITERDADNDAAFRRWEQRAIDLASAQYGDDEESPGALAALAAQRDLRGEHREAADLYLRAIAAAGEHADDLSTHALRVRLGELLVRLGEYADAVVALTPALAALGERYVTAVLPDDMAEIGAWYTDAAATLTVAHAGLSDWSGAFATMDQAKSLRLRYQAAVRGTPAGRALLPIERRLDGVRRRIVPPDAPGEAPDGEDEDRLIATLQARLLEEYRRARPSLAAELLESPTTTALAELLDPGEAVIALAMHAQGTVVAVVSTRDGAAHADGLLCEDWTTERWLELFTGEDGQGWLAALVMPEEVDSSAVLAQCLAEADGLAERIASLLDPVIRRVTVIPHALLHIVAFWALPSLNHLDVLIAPNAAQLANGRRRGAARVAGQALVVSNPTLDLPLSALESMSVRRHLERPGLRIAELDGPDATEARVATAVATATALHFTGHGRSHWADADRSGLLLHPGDEHTPGVDPFDVLLDGPLQWRYADDPLADEERWANVPDVGCLCESVDDLRLERRLECEGSTLVASYRDDELVRVGELWSAGDMMLDQAADGCAFAFLSACEAGMGGARRVDENGGLPAALQLAGVRTLVAAMWPVSEPLTAIYVELFYEELASRTGCVDVAAVLRRTRERLAAMTRDDALALVALLRRSTDSIAARLTLDRFAREVRERGDPPFVAAWELAAFYVTGLGTVDMGDGHAHTG